jgi:murein L,D-transpeptidase YafK
MILVRKYLIIVCILVNISYALGFKDVVKTYINQGQEEVIKDLELILTNKQFWHTYISDVDTKYGYFGYKDYLILSSKTSKNLEIYKINNKNPKLITTIPALFGAINGDKNFEGDKKTPIGLYDFIARLDKGNKNLADKFGPLAFVTTYPNLMDKLIYKKTGHGIWLHGKPDDTGTKLDTLGCIAIDNDKLTTLGKTINYKKAIIVIAKDKYATSTKDEIATLFVNLYTWRYYWLNSDFQNYISYYAPNFKRYDKKTLQQFIEFKKPIFDKKEKKEILFSKINIIPYFQSDGKKLFKISFYEKYSSKNYKFQGQKNLYVQLINDKMSIIVEE